MVAWNTIPEYVVKQPGLRDLHLSKLLIAAIGFYLAAQFSPVFGFHPSSTACVAFQSACYTAAVISATLILQKLRFWFITKPLWESLNDGQRKLLGMETTTVRGRPPALAAQARSPSLVSPPNRPQRPILPSAAADEMQVGQKSRTPESRGATFEGITPEKLQRILDDFDESMDAMHATSNVASGCDPQFGFSGPSNVVHTPTSSPSTYRPSAVSKGGPAVTRADGRVMASPPLQRARVLDELGWTEEYLEVAVEKLREWYAAEVLQPLHAAVRTIHEEIIQCASQTGFSGVRLTPLGELVTDPAARAADDSMTLGQMRERFEELLKRNYGQRAELLACMQKVVKYQKLLLLLRGEFPSGLLPPSPDGYIYKRVVELANGSCMVDYEWNEGGTWNNKRWSPEMPTDSAVLLYLFAAYLAAPQWSFLDEDPGKIEGPAGILYLGKMPPRVSGEYYAVVPTRHPAGTKANGVIGVQLGTQQPHFSFVWQGETLLTESGQNALFIILALFLRQCSRKGGAIGGRSVDTLNLGPVANPPKIALSLRRLANAFRMW